MSPSSCVSDVLDLTTGDFDLSALERGLARVWCFKDLLELFEGLSSCLNEEEVDKCNLNADPSNVHQVQLPSNLLHTDRDTVCVDDHGNVEEEEVGSRALCASTYRLLDQEYGELLATLTVLQAFNGVQGLEWCPTPGEDDTKAVDRNDSAVSEIICRLCGGGEGGQQDVEEQRTCQTTKQHFATTKLVEESGSVDSAEHTEDGVYCVDKQLLVGIGDTGVLDHGGHEIAYYVVAYAPLDEKSSHQFNIRSYLTIDRRRP